MVNCSGKGNPLLPSEIDLPLLCAAKRNNIFFCLKFNILVFYCCLESQFHTLFSVHYMEMGRVWEIFYFQCYSF